MSKPVLLSLPLHQIFDTNNIRGKEIIFDYTDTPPVTGKYFVVIKVQLLRDQNICKIHRQFPHQDLEFPPQVVEDLKNGRVNLIFDHCWESAFMVYPPMEGLKDLVIDFDAVSEKYGIPKSQIIFLIGNQLSSDHLEQLKRHNGVTILNYNYLMSLMSPFLNDDNIYNNFYSVKVKSILDQNIVPYQALCYNRKIRPDRLITLTYLQQLGLLDQINYSAIIPPTKHQIIKAQESYLRMFGTDLPESNFLNSGQYPFETQYRNKQLYDEINTRPTAVLNTFEISHSMTSNFQIVVESYPNIKMFITEKTAKPMAMLQPFVIFGSMGSIQQLRDWGYEVFDSFIDHSYDTIADAEQRHAALLNETVRLLNIDKTQWAQLLYDNLPGLIHNYHMIKNKFNQFDSDKIELERVCRSLT